VLIPCTVDSVRVHVLSGQHVVLLQPKDSDRLLPIWIGSDQLTSRGCYPAIITGPKWVQVGAWWIGCCGAHRSQQLIARMAVPDTADPFVFANAIRQTLMDDGYERKKIGDDPEGESPLFSFTACMVTPDHRLINIDSGLSVAEGMRDTFITCGSGADYASGVIHYLESMALKPSAESRVLEAVRVAIALDRGCGGEPWVHKLSASPFANSARPRWDP
jgi:hypothetical protein